MLLTCLPNVAQRCVLWSVNDDLQARADIESQKQELEAAKLERKRLVEYEALRQQIAAQPPRWKTQARDSSQPCHAIALS